MASMPLSPQLRELLARLASHPHGLGFLHLGELECISVTLEVHPRYVIEARDLLATERGRVAIIAEYRRARTRIAARGPLRSPDPSRSPCMQPGTAAATGTVQVFPKAASGQAATVRSGPQSEGTRLDGPHSGGAHSDGPRLEGPVPHSKLPTSRRGPEELIEAAKRHPLGIPFLLDAPFETVSITFQVCPHVVFAARELIRRIACAESDVRVGKSRGPTF